MTLYMLVTNDKYELPLIVEDSAEKLARKLNINVHSIYSSMSKARKHGYKTQYVRVKLQD